MAQGMVEYCHRGFLHAMHGICWHRWLDLGLVAMSVARVLTYADDIVLLAPSWRGLQHLLDIVMQQCESINNMSLSLMTGSLSVWFFFSVCLV